MPVSGWDETKLSLFIIIFAFAVIAIVILARSGYRLTPATLPYRIIVTVLGLGVIVLVVIKLFIHDGDLGIYYGIFISLAASIAVIVGGVMLSRERSEGAAAVEPKDRAHSLR